MKFQNAKIKMLDLDLKGCVYLNHLSQTQAVALFFKTISRLGDGPFWYVMLLSVWIMQGLAYGLQILYLIVAGSAGTLIYKFLKPLYTTNFTEPLSYQASAFLKLPEFP